MDWYRWFPRLYAEDTLHLTLEQDAIYRRLIDWYMLGRMPLPSQATALARICQISLDKWQEHESIVLALFKQRGGKYHQKRCDIELDRQDSTSKRLSEAAKKAHDTRKKTSTLSNNSEPCHSQGSTKVAIEEKRGDIEERKKEAKASFYDDGFEEFWKLWDPFDIDKGSKSKAETSYLKSRKEVTHETIIGGVGRYIGYCHAKQQRTKHAVSWLNAKGWADEYPDPARTPFAGKANGSGYSNGRQGTPSVVAATLRVIETNDQRKDKPSVF